MRRLVCCFCVEFGLPQEEDQDDNAGTQQHIQHIPKLSVHDTRNGDNTSECDDGRYAVHHADGAGNGGSDCTGDPCPSKILSGEGDRSFRNAGRGKKERGYAELPVGGIEAAAQ